MSECFDGRNGKSVKTLGDLRDLRDLQFEEIGWKWNCCRFTGQVFYYGASGICTRCTIRYGSV